MLSHVIMVPWARVVPSSGKSSCQILLTSACRPVPHRMVDQNQTSCSEEAKLRPGQQNRVLQEAVARQRGIIDIYRVSALNHSILEWATSAR